jgi:small-conductance mechanosensitive channel
MFGSPPLLATLFEFAGPEHSLHVLGIRLVGINAENGKKLLFSLALILLLALINAGLRAIAHSATGDNKRIAFWFRQATRLLLTVVLAIGLLSIWFNDTSRLGAAAGFVTAGVAFALQRVITAFAAYLIILRGKTFNVGDRIMMGGVRGDVISLGFMQTTIMEMGQPPGEQGDEPSMWVHSRQYTGRVVTVTNDKIFDTPVYNYTLQFPYIWEEMKLPISYKDDRKRAEQILLAAAEKHTVKIAEVSEPDLCEMERRYTMRRSELKPKIYLRLTDNWVELSVRFIAHDHGVRELKDVMSREIIDNLDAAGIGIASGTYEIVGLPPIRLQQPPPPDTAQLTLNAPGGDGR